MAGRNMEITVAKTAGFCFGVKRAVEKVYDQIATGKKPIYTYGPIIHMKRWCGIWKRRAYRSSIRRRNWKP